LVIFLSRQISFRQQFASRRQIKAMVSMILKAIRLRVWFYTSCEYFVIASMIGNPVCLPHFVISLNPFHHRDTHDT
jgi:hypothetical protein